VYTLGQWKTYLIAVAIVCLLVGVGIGWVAKPIPPPGPEWVSKASYDALKADYDKIKADLEKVKADLEKTKADLDKALKEITELKKPPVKPTLVIAMDTSSIVSLDPAEAYEFEGVLTDNNVYDKLVDFRGADCGTVYPELAESWSISPDGKTWTFHIRKGIKFPSGTPVDADAVVFSLKRVVKLKKTPSWVITQFGITEASIKKVGDYDVEITLNAVYAPGMFLSCLAFPVASIVDPKVVMEHEVGGDMGSAWMKDHSAGAGPFILEKWERGTEIVLVANKDYWKGAPQLGKITIKEVVEPLTQKMLLEKGDVDIAWNLLPDQIIDVEGKPGIEILRSPGFQVFYVGMNVVLSKPLSDERVRDAIRYAIDYDAIIDVMLKGAAIKVQTIIPKGVAGYNPAMPYYQDFEKAKRLLAEAGYPDGFTVKLTTPATIAQIPTADIAAKIKSDLANIGINAEIELLTYAELLTKYRAQSLEMVIGRWGSDYADPDANAKPFAHCNTTGPEATVKQLAWRNMYVNAYTTELVEKAAKELDTKKRMEYYKEITDIILDKGPFVILYQLLNQRAVRTYVEGLVVSPLTLEDFSVIRKMP